MHAHHLSDDFNRLFETEVLTRSSIDFTSHSVHGLVTVFLQTYAFGQLLTNAFGRFFGLTSLVTHSASTYRQRPSIQCCAAPCERLSMILDLPLSITAVTASKREALHSIFFSADRSYANWSCAG